MSSISIDEFNALSIADKVQFIHKNNYNSMGSILELLEEIKEQKLLLEVNFESLLEHTKKLENRNQFQDIIIDKFSDYEMSRYYNLDEIKANPGKIFDLMEVYEQWSYADDTMDFLGYKLGDKNEEIIIEKIKDTISNMSLEDSITYIKHTKPDNFNDFIYDCFSNTINEDLGKILIDKFNEYKISEYYDMDSIKNTPSEILDILKHCEYNGKYEFGDKKEEFEEIKKIEFGD